MPAEPLRVLLVSGPATGGIRRHLQNLLEGLPARGVVLGLAAPSDLSTLSDQSDVRHWPVGLGDRPRPPQVLAALLTLRRAVREFRPDLVHAHGAKAALLTLLLPLPGRPPILATLHNLWRGGALTSVLRGLLPRAKAVICVSEAVRESLLAHGLAIAQTPIIPNGVALPPQSTREPGDLVTVAYVGRLTDEKGIDVLMEAWEAILKSKALNGSGRLRLVVAGDGPLQAGVRQWALRPDSDAAFLGHVEAVGPLYESADFVVIPSRSEGQSLTALEAMSHGLPVIASSVGGLREVVVDSVTGILFPPGSTYTLVKAITGLARDRALRSRLGEAGRVRVEQHFSLERMLERTRDAYESTASRV